MKMKKIACLILSVTIFLLVCGCGKKGFVILPAPYDSATKYEYTLNGEVARVGEYGLSFDETFGFPILSKNGVAKKWDSSLEGSYSSSTLYVKLYDPTYEAFVTVKSVDAAAEGRVKTETVTDGVRVTYFFDEYEVAVPVYYTLNENGLNVKVVSSEIEEHNFIVMSVSVNPFLCNAKNEKNKERYLVIPSGSGALIYTDERGDPRLYEEEVYGEDLAREKKWLYANTQQIHLPVFGAVDGSEAIYGIITSGAECASIGAHAGDEVLGYSGVYPVYNVRSYNTVQVNIGGTTGLKDFIKIADKRNSEVFEVQYSLLSGENASYNGIAAAYRNYLGLKSGVDNKLLNLIFLGGVMANRSALGVPYTEFSPTTTITQAKDIISELYNSNKIPMNIRLVGYGETGMSVDKIAGAFEINSKLGSKSDASDLQKYCNDIKSDLFMEYDVLQFATSGKGYSTRNDVTLDTTGYRVKKYSFDISLRNVDKTVKSKYLLSRSNISNVTNDVLEALDKYGIKGVSLDTLGRMAYSDFSDTKYYGKGKIDDDVSKALKTVTDSKVKLLTSSANDYAAKLSDYIDSIPTVSSNTNAIDVDIPFYGIVFSGCKETSVAVNLSSQPRKKFLNALKTGSGLSFVLASEINSDVIGSEYSAYISADYDTNKESINDYLNEAKDFLNSVSGVSVKNYEILARGVSKTVFENGVTIYINETVNDAVYEDVTIKSMSFEVR